MPRHDVDLKSRQLSPGELIDPDDNLVQVENFLRIKQKGSDGSWSPNGTYGSGKLAVDTWRPTLVHELTGFWHIVEDEDKGTIGYRMSIDEGATELYWDGTTWRSPAAGEWNTELEIDAGVGSLPRAASYTTIVYLESSDGKGTPKWRGFYLFYEVDYDPSEDLLRSCMEKVLAEAEVAARDIAYHEFPSLTVQFPEEGTTWLVNEPIRVFNLDNDPNRTNDLFESFNGQEITLSSEQTGTLEVFYRGKFRHDQVHVSTDGDYQLQRLPSVVIFDRTQTRVRDDLEPGFHEQLRSKEVVRIRPNPARHQYRLDLTAISQFVPHDRKSGDALRRAFDTKEWIRSLALDEEFPLVGVELVSQTNQTRDQMFSRTVQVEVSILEWLPAAREVPMVFKITDRKRLGGNVVSSVDTE